MPAHHSRNGSCRYIRAAMTWLPSFKKEGCYDSKIWQNVNVTGPGHCIGQNKKMVESNLNFSQGKRQKATFCLLYSIQNPNCRNAMQQKLFMHDLAYRTWISFYCHAEHLQVRCVRSFFQSQSLGDKFFTSRITQILFF